VFSREFTAFRVMAATKKQNDAPLDKDVDSRQSFLSVQRGLMRKTRFGPGPRQSFVSSWPQSSSRQVRLHRFVATIASLWSIVKDAGRSSVWCPDQRLRRGFRRMVVKWYSTLRTMARYGLRSCPTSPPNAGSRPRAGIVGPCGRVMAGAFYTLPTTKVRRRCSGATLMAPECPNFSSLSFRQKSKRAIAPKTVHGEIPAIESENSVQILALGKIYERRVRDLRREFPELTNKSRDRWDGFVPEGQESDDPGTKP
jgi:hypothetical protein